MLVFTVTQLRKLSSQNENHKKSRHDAKSVAMQQALTHIE